MKKSKAKSKRNKIVNHGKIVREIAMADGFYDGRFMSRTYKDKKKHANKNACRDKVEY